MKENRIYVNNWLIGKNVVIEEVETSITKSKISIRKIIEIDYEDESVLLDGYVVVGERRDGNIKERRISIDEDKNNCWILCQDEPCEPRVIRIV